MVEREKLKVNSSGQKELDHAQEQLDNFEKDVKSMTLDRMNQAPTFSTEPQTKLSEKELNSKEIYLKPEKTVSCRDKFNEKFKQYHNFIKEYVCFMAENREVIGETIEIWTRPLGGMPAEFWKVPTNKKIYGPRYLADQIKKCHYHRLTMQNTMTEQNYAGQMYGTLVADNVIQRLDAIPISDKKSVFLGASGF